MPTKYDVFARIIEKAPCKQKDLEFRKPVYLQVDVLVKDGWVKKSKQGVITPIKNQKTENIFNIIKWSLKNNVNYNLWFSENFKKILKTFMKTLPSLNPKELANNKKNAEIMRFLEKSQFVLTYKRNPKLGVLLNNKIIRLVQQRYDVVGEIKEKFNVFDEIVANLLKIPRREINPFDTNIFEFLAGSAQLEGSTVSVGETVDLFLKDIYPDKPSKDIQMVKNLNEAMSYVIENIEENLTIEHIKEINRMCLFSLHKGAGMLKKTQNKIAGNPSFKTTPPSKVLLELTKFCKDFNDIKTRKDCLEKIGYIHNQHQRIHPFVDGNSRTTRLLVNWLLIKFKFPLLVLKVGSFESYMGLTKLSKKRNDEFLANFLVHLIWHEEFGRV